MMEVTAVTLQTVPQNGNVIFTANPVRSKCGRIHTREDSGLVSIQGPGIYKVSFTGNIGLPADGTAGTIGVSLALDGEMLQTSQMIQEADPGKLYNVSRTELIRISNSCCYTLSVQNTTTTQPITVREATLVVERVA